MLNPGEHSDGELQVGAGGVGDEGRAVEGEGREVPGGHRRARGRSGRSSELLLLLIFFLHNWSFGHLGAPQEKMVAKEEALKKREEELVTAKVLTRAWENCFIVV